MNRFTANYLWDFKPPGDGQIPVEYITLNERFVRNSNIVRPGDIEPLICHYPDLEKLWNRIPHWVIKTDLGRLLYIYFNGNLYFDVDCVIRKKISIRAQQFFILFTEMIVSDVSKLGPRECKNPENVLRVANYAFGTNVIRHPFLNEVILECIDRLDFFIREGGASLTHQDILWVCGPDVITSIYHKSKSRYPDLVLLDTSFIAHLAKGSWR